MKDRIRQVMEWAHLSQQDFASRLEVSAASLSSIFTGRTNPTNNHVMAIHRVFPAINVNWLMFGEGTMLDGSSAATEGADPALVSPIQKEAASPTVEIAGMPSMFSQADFESPGHYHPAVANSSSRGREVAGMRTTMAREYENPKRIDKPMRKIKEIRVFFDDGTYESFTPSSGK